VIVCKVCGFDNEAGAAFCGSCGSFLEWTGESTDTGAPKPATPTGAPPNTAPPPVPVAPPPVLVQASADPDAVICPSCGMANERDRVFCKRCATELAPAPSEPVGTGAPSGRSGIPPGPVIVGIALAVVVVGGALVFGGILGKGTSPTSSAGATTAVASVAPSASAVTPSPIVSSPSPSASASPLPPPTGQIAYSKGALGKIDIFVAAPDGTGETRIVHDTGNEIQAAWSPDGKKIAYEGAAGIRIVDADGKNGIQFTHHNGEDAQPAWSSDGSIIAFTSKRDGDYEIYLRHVAKDDLIQLTKNTNSDTNPSWSPTEDLIAFVSDRAGNKDIWTMASDGSKPVNLTSDPSQDDGPAWSPDGKSIAFTSDRDGSTSFVYVMDADGGNVRRLTTGSAPEFDPTWSPDGTDIAFRRGQDTGTIVVAAAANGQEIDTFGNPTDVARNPAWH
jgi:WD40-like Beta Propeller Repeat